ncbi:uncharacterized protein LOC142583463 isoform X2 [Dermacentor variabilis]|uniref:uncharacterized protein LOC142583463 isoform X2 n=1 Tax=Dermacentor variabilis TaxID=34621 RepID=UPI003F5BF851
MNAVQKAKRRLSSYPDAFLRCSKQVPDCFFCGGSCREDAGLCVSRYSFKNGRSLRRRYGRRLRSHAECRPRHCPV